MHSATFSIGGDIDVHRLGYGAMALTGPGGWGKTSNPDGARALLRQALDLGVQLIDTADSYGPEVSEELLADALHPYPADLKIATKGGSVRTGPWQLHADGRPGHLRAACEGSLRRLRLERIDLYQLHAVDPSVPYEESIGALAELAAEGKIRHIGLSNVTANQVASARRIVPIASVQNEYNLASRRTEADVISYCEREGLAYLTWQPLAKGSLARAHGALGMVADRHGATAAQVALAWLLAHSPVIIPIPGTLSSRHLAENMGAAQVELSPDDLAVLESFSLPALDARALARRLVSPRFRRAAVSILRLTTSLRRRG